MVSDSPPLEDYKAHQELLKRAASLLDIQAEEVCQKTHKLVDIIALTGLSRVALPGFKYLYSHTPAGSLVVAAAMEQKRQGHQTLTPKGKELKRLDLFGRKLDLTRGLQLRIANQQALLSHCDLTLGKYHEV